MRWSPDFGWCSQTDYLREVPCNEGRVMEGVSLTASGSLSVDVPRVEIQGVVTVNGAVMASSSQERGDLVKQRVSDSAAVSVGMADLARGSIA